MDNKELNVKLSLNNVNFEIDNSPDTGNKQLESQSKNYAHFYENQTQIAELLKQQDTAAIAHLYDAYGSALYGVVLRIVRSKEVAEQVLQDTFLKVWHKGASFDASKGRLYTWLLNIARNTAIDATRSSHFHNRKNTDSIDNLTHILDAESLNPDTVGLREIVKKLDEKYMVLIDLIYFNQYTHIEAAEAMGLPLGTVKTRVRHALLELRKAFVF